VECKASSAPQVTKGFWRAIETTKPDKTYIVAPVSASYPFKNDVEVCGLSNFLKKIDPKNISSTSVLSNEDA